MFQQKEEVDQLQRELGRQRKLHASQSTELEQIKSALLEEQQTRRDTVKLEQENRVTLEQIYNSERQRREDAEAQLRDTIRISEETVTQGSNLRSEMLNTKEELAEARKLLEQYALQLGDAHTLVADITHIYGQHVSSSVSISVCRHLKLDNARLGMLKARLDRKLADRVDQVAELAQMILHVSEQNALLTAELRTADEEIHCLRDALLREQTQCPRTSDTSEPHALSTSLSGLDASIRRTSNEDTAAHQSITAHLSDRYGKAFHSILNTLSEQAQLTELQERHADVLLTHAEREISTLSSRALAAESIVASKDNELASKQDELVRQTEMVAGLRMRDDDLERRAAEAEECLAQESAEARRAHAAHLVQMRGLNDVLSRARMAENGLRDDVSK